MAEVDVDNKLFDDFEGGSSDYAGADYAQQQPAYNKAKINFNVRNTGTSKPEEDMNAGAYPPRVQPMQQRPENYRPQPNVVRPPIAQGVSQQPQGAASGMGQMQQPRPQQPPQGAASGMGQMQQPRPQQPPQGAASGMGQMQQPRPQQPPQGAASGMGQQQPRPQQPPQGAASGVGQMQQPRPQQPPQGAASGVGQMQQPRPQQPSTNGNAGAYDRMAADIAAMSRSIKTHDSKFDSSLDAVKSRVDNSWQDLGKKLDNSATVATDRYERQQSEQNKGFQDVTFAVNASKEEIMAQIAANSRRGDAELNRLTPSQHYRNMKFSILAVILAVFSALMLCFGFLSFINAAVAKIASAIIIIDFCFVYLIAAGAIALALVQKAIFFPKGSIKDYIKSKNPTHAMSKIAFFTACITAMVNTVMIIIVMIVVLV